jgi:hypothetical protein
LSWDGIQPPTPGVVLTYACSSGSASIVVGGERVSLDRAFFAGGTHLFFGPMWDVAIDEGQELVNMLAARAFEGEMNWAATWQAVLADACSDVSPASWQSFVLIGDWRANVR